MEIRINDEIVDYTLENEKALGEVVDGIQEWLASNGFTVTTIKKDDTDLTMNGRLQWQDDPLKEIASLQITALHPTDLAIDKLTAAIQYLTLITEDGKPDSQVVADLLKGIDDVSQMIDDAAVSDSSETATLGTQFRNLAYATGIPEGHASLEKFEEFHAFVSMLIVVLDSRLRELSDPADELRRFVPALRDALSKASEISVLLQTGKDSEAIGQLIRFIEANQKLLRLVGNLGNQGMLNLGLMEVDGVTAGEFTGELNRYLRELSQAIETGDTVLVGDLLEYEIGTRLTALIEAIEKSGAL